MFEARLVSNPELFAADHLPSLEVAEWLIRVLRLELSDLAFRSPSS